MKVFFLKILIDSIQGREWDGGADSPHWKRASSISMCKQHQCDWILWFRLLRFVWELKSWKASPYPRCRRFLCSATTAANTIKKIALLFKQLFQVHIELFPNYAMDQLVFCIEIFFGDKKCLVDERKRPREQFELCMWLWLSSKYLQLCSLEMFESDFQVTLSIFVMKIPSAKARYIICMIRFA